MLYTFTLLIYISWSLLSLILLVLLIRQYFMDRHKNYEVHSLTNIMAVFMLFLFLDGVYETFLLASQIQIVSPEFFLNYGNPNIGVLSKLGIIVSTVLFVHALLDKRIEELKSKEDGHKELTILNKELEERAKELESSQDVLQKKVLDLEKFNSIAKEREHKMVELIKKIEHLEAQQGNI